MRKNILFIITIIVMSGCSFPENLGIPSWTTKLKMNFINSEYDIIQLADEDSSLVAIGDTLFLIKTMNESEEIEFSSEAVSDEINKEVGDIELDDTDPVSTQIPLSEFVPDLIDGYVPEPGIAPFILPQIVKDDVDPFEEFLEATAISGYARISVTNNTAIWFGNVANGEPLVISLLDSENNLIVMIDFSEDAPPNATETIIELADLSGKTFFNEIKIMVDGGSRGTDGSSATINVSATLDIDVEIIDLVLSHGIAKIASQDIDVSSLDVELDEDIMITRAVVADGDYVAYANFENSIDLGLYVTITIEDLKLAGEEESFIREIFVPGSGGVGQTSYYTEIIDLTGAELGNGEILEFITIEFDAYTEDSGEEYREINSTDIYNASFEINELEFENFEGYINPREQDEIEGEDEIDIEYPYVVGDFSFSGQSTINFTVDTPISASLILNLEVFNDDNESLTLLDTNGQLPAINISAGGSEIIFTSEQYNINELISIFPTNIFYTIEPVVGLVGEHIIYNAGDEISAEIIIEAALDIDANCFFIPKNEYGEPDVQLVDTKAIEQQQIDAFVSGFISLNYLNSLGFSAGIDLLISETKTIIFDDLIDPDPTMFTVINIPVLEECADSIMKQINIEIFQDDLQIMLADSVFIVPKLLIISEAGTPISGSIELQGKIELDIKVSNDLIEDN